jgi:hypothetical protein
MPEPSPFLKGPLNAGNLNNITKFTEKATFLIVKKQQFSLLLLSLYKECDILLADTGTYALGWLCVCLRKTDGSRSR